MIHIYNALMTHAAATPYWVWIILFAQIYLTVGIMLPMTIHGWAHGVANILQRDRGRKQAYLFAIVFIVCWPVASRVPLWFGFVKTPPKEKVKT